MTSGAARRRRRPGRGENSRAALERALALGVDVVEFDVQRLADGTQAHIDLEFRSPAAAYAEPSATWEVAAARAAAEALGPEGLVVTTLDDESVRAVRDWADAEGLPLRVGLSLGRSTEGMAVGERVRARTSEVVARPRVRESRANVVVAQQRLVRAGVVSFARRTGLPLLVWTVDEEEALRLREEVENRSRRAAREARRARRGARAGQAWAGEDRGRRRTGRMRK